MSRRSWNRGIARNLYNLITGSGLLQAIPIAMLTVWTLQSDFDLRFKKHFKFISQNKLKTLFNLDEVFSFGSWKPAELTKKSLQMETYHRLGSRSKGYKTRQW